jgi:GGDEF domain-containing protein
LPGASLDLAEAAVQRLLSRGLGVLPERAPVTASIGLAERKRDAADDWWRLVDLAEVRMRRARAAGGNCTFAG